MSDASNMQESEHLYQSFEWERRAQFNSARDSIDGRAMPPPDCRAAFCADGQGEERRAIYAKLTGSSDAIENRVSAPRGKL